MIESIYHPHAQVRALARRDERIARLLERVGPVRIPQRASTFETIARSIVYQQLTGRAAGTIWDRLLLRFEGQELEPAPLLRKRLTTLRAAGLSTAKAASLRDLARHVLDGRLEPEGLPDLDDESVFAALTQVKGIGPWSAHMHLIFSLARPDVWPTGDLGVRKGLQRFLGLHEAPSAEEAEALGEPYRPWRTIVAWSMWRIHDVESWVG